MNTRVSLREFVQSPTRFLFFTGKGGVGKTSLACATAMALADADRRVVLDTEAYHREVARRASDMPDEVRQLLPRLRDPDFTRILIVTLPEATPVHEAAALQHDLRRAQIEPLAWVINQSFADSGSRDPLLRSRGHSEFPFIREVVSQHARQVALVPWVSEEPVGPEKLQQLFKHTSRQPTLDRLTSVEMLT